MTTSNRSNYDTEIQKSPLKFVSSGYYDYNSSVRGQSSGGYDWESALYDNVSARYILFTSGFLLPQYMRDKGNGLSIRCLVPLDVWQLPTYSGTKSYQNLLVEVYGGIYGNPSGPDSLFLQKPINLIRGGFASSDGGISKNLSSAMYWYSGTYSNKNAYYVYLGSGRYTPADAYFTKGEGFPLRCLVR